MASPSSQAVCTAFKEASIPLSQDDSSGTIPPSNANYMPYCGNVLDQALRLQLADNPNTPVRLWTPELVKQVQAFSEKNKVSIWLGSPRHHLSIGAPFMGGQGRIYIFPFKRAPRDTAELQFSLSHEYGHLEDFKKLRQIKASFTDIMLQKVSLEKIKTFRRDLIEIVASKLPRQQKGQFRQQADRLLTVYGELKMASTLLLEAFRAGEELPNEQIWRMMKESSVLHFSVPPPIMAQSKDDEIRTLNAQMVKAYFVAAAHEAGWWDEFSSLPQFNEKSMDDVDPETVSFFRTMISTSRRFFPPKKSSQ